MDMGGIGRSLKAGLIKQAPATDGVAGQKESMPDRDPSRQFYEGPERHEQLTAEQEDEAIKLLNEMEAFKFKNLRAKLIREEGKAPYIEVKDFFGKVVRQLPYEQIVEIYLKRNTESTSGLLLKKSA